MAKYGIDKWQLCSSEIYLFALSFQPIRVTGVAIEVTGVMNNLFDSFHVKDLDWLSQELIDVINQISVRVLLELKALLERV